MLLQETVTNCILLFRVYDAQYETLVSWRSVEFLMLNSTVLTLQYSGECKEQEKLVQRAGNIFGSKSAPLHSDTNS